MSDTKLTEEQVADLVPILRSDRSLDAKAQYVNTIKSGIKQHNVPEICIPQLFDGLRTASSSQHTAIVSVGFTALNHLLTRLSRQDPKILSKQAPHTLPLIIEKLGDQKEKLRATATQSLNTLYIVAPSDVERFIRNSAMTGKNPRAKEGAMEWLLNTHREKGLQFKPYVPILMELLEDADGMVRDVAKSTVIELFQHAPAAAKSDLKRQLKNFKVRPAIEQAIVKALAPTGGRPETPADSLPASRPLHTATSTSSVSITAAERPTTPATEKSEYIEPQYVNTNRELDDIFKGMTWYFEGKESEQNWMKREESIITLRKLIAGNTASEFHDAFVSGLRAMLDGIMKAINSLRTSLSKEGCSLVQEMAVALGPSMEPMVELLMQTLLKLSGGTKKIASQQANATIDIILSHIPYSHRLMQHMWAACQDKNVQPRTYASGWIKTLLKKEAGHKSHIEHSGGCDLLEKCIKRGLGDANPTVREKMRGTYWIFYGIWTQRANAIMEDLDPTAQKLLNKDPNNPNSSNKGEAPRPGMGLSKSTIGHSKPSIREHMMAQKKAAALAARNNLPARPTSAMAQLSPARKSESREPPAKPTGSRTRPEAGTISVNASGMSVAPVRPRKRPEIAPRPATAGPYSVREAPSSIEGDSPTNARKKAATVSKVKETTPKRTAAASRSRPGHASHASESGIPSPSPIRSKSIPTPHETTMMPSPTARAKTFASPTSVSTPPKFRSSRSIHTGSPQSKPRDGHDLVEASVPSPQELSASPPNYEKSHPDVEVESPRPVEAVPVAPSPRIHVPQITFNASSAHPSGQVKIFEDPFTEDQHQPVPKSTITVPVLEDKSVNEVAVALQNSAITTSAAERADTPDKARQNSRLLDSGIAKIRTKSLEVHGFRKLQSLLRGNGLVFNNEKFEALLIGLFQFLEDPMTNMASDKTQDVKTQILATIKLLLKMERDNFRPYISRCLESLLQTRSVYDSRAHIASGLELLADDLVNLGDSSEIIVVLGRYLQACADTDTTGCRTLNMGLHILRTTVDRATGTFLPDNDLEEMSALAGRCLQSADSGVRMGAVQLCVALHASVGEERFWAALRDVRDDPKSLITYYIVKRQRESGMSG